jgi:uncharacterized protein YjbJ (UPF0337 family)
MTAALARAFVTRGGPVADLEDVKGRVKEAAGSLFGDKSKKSEGRAQQEKAEAQEKAAESQQDAAEAEAIQRRNQ